MLNFFKRFISTILILLVLLLGLYNYARYIEPNQLKEKELALNTPISLGTVGEVKIALFADTHFSENYDLKDFSKVVSAINAQNPDVVIFAGDLIDKYNSYTGDTAAISQSLLEINAVYGKYAIFGNHDYGGGAERVYEDIMQVGGFTVLKNEYQSLDSLNMGIIGIDDYLIGYGKSDIATWARPDYYNVAISHAPDIMDEVLGENIDTMLSGHTHGRQINLPFLDDQILPPLGKKYVKGLYTFENNRESILYVNSGLGTTKLPLRFLATPEVTFITIKSNSVS